MDLFVKPKNVQTRWSSFENQRAERGQAALTNRGSKGRAFERFPNGSAHVLCDARGSGTVRRIWLTISDRSPAALRGVRIEAFWDDAKRPAVAAPLGDFFGVGLGRRTGFECALFSDPQGQSFNCAIPMPFRKAARIVLTNESGSDLSHLFYDVDLTLGDEHPSEALYFHACFRREAPNELGQNFVILPRVEGPGRFLGCNLGLIESPDYEGMWWGEGEMKVWFGSDEHPTLCGTGLEDYLGAAWGLNAFAHRFQGCPIIDRAHRHWAFYRYHVEDPIWFDDGCRVAVQTIGGGSSKHVRKLMHAGKPIIPVSIDPSDRGAFVRLMDRPGPSDLSATDLPEGWCNFWRQDDWSATAYLYLATPEGVLPPLTPAAERIAGIEAVDDATKRSDS